MSAPLTGYRYPHNAIVERLARAWRLQEEWPSQNALYELIEEFADRDVEEEAEAMMRFIRTHRVVLPRRAHLVHALALWLAGEDIRLVAPVAA